VERAENAEGDAVHRIPAPITGRLPAGGRRRRPFQMR
jgi:hypothetical protein